MTRIPCSNAKCSVVRKQRDQLLEGVAALIEMGVPCPFNSSDGRYAEWFKVWERLQAVVDEAPVAA